MDEDALSHRIIGASIEVHRNLGPGLLESIYETALEMELKELGLRTRRQVELPVLYKGKLLEGGYRIDLIVEDSGHHRSQGGRKTIASVRISTADISEAVGQKARTSH